MRKTKGETDKHNEWWSLTAKQRLVIVSGSFPNIGCGVSRHVEIIAQETARLGGYDVHVLTSDDPVVETGAVEGYQVHRRIKNWGVCQSKTICREILALAPEIVHIQNPTIKYTGLRTLTMSLVGPMLKRMAPAVRLVVMQHDIAVGRRIFRRRYRPLFKAADAVVVSNERDYRAVLDQKTQVQKVYRAPVGSHIKMAVPTAGAKAAARNTLGIPDGAMCVCYFGFVHPGRNIDALIRAMALLRKEGRDVYGLIIGGPFAAARGYYRKCQKLAEELRLGRHITWTGYADEKTIIDGMAGADVFVSLPARGADMRNTSIITAMLAGLPVVTSQNKRYYTDTNLESLGCACIEGADPRKIAEAIIKAYETPLEAAILARRLAWFDPETVWQKHVQVNLRAYRAEPPLAGEIVTMH